MQADAAGATPVHTFHAVAFVENLVLRELAPIYPAAQRATHELRVPHASGGLTFVYPFGAMVFFDMPARDREDAVMRLRSAQPKLTSTTVIKEEFMVREDA
ncbi:MAG: hypothetical protein RL033_865, partial [Pseudomonadota bacterium]